MKNITRIIFALSITSMLAISAFAVDSSQYPVNDFGYSYGSNSGSEAPDLTAVRGHLHHLEGYSFTDEFDTPPTSNEYACVDVYSLDMELIDVFKTPNHYDYYCDTGDMSVDLANDFIERKGRATENAVATPVDIFYFDNLKGYYIDGEQYIKIRDLLSVYNEKEYEMSLRWRPEENAIYLDQSGCHFDDITAPPYEGERTAIPSHTDLFVNGIELYMPMYLIDNSNYVNLADFSQFMNEINTDYSSIYKAQPVQMDSYDAAFESVVDENTDFVLIQTEECAIISYEIAGIPGSCGGVALVYKEGSTLGEGVVVILPSPKVSGTGGSSAPEHIALSPDENNDDYIQYSYTFDECVWGFDWIQEFGTYTYNTNLRTGDTVLIID